MYNMIAIRYAVSILVEVLVSDFVIICNVHCMKGNNGMSSILDMGQLFIHIFSISYVAKHDPTCFVGIFFYSPSQLDIDKHLFVS